MAYQISSTHVKRCFMIGVCKFVYNSSDTYVCGFTFFFVCDEDECFRWRRIIRLDEDSFRHDTLILLCLTTFGTVLLLVLEASLWSYLKLHFYAVVYILQMY